MVLVLTGVFSGRSSGEVGLDKLRKTAQLVRDVPSLNAVLHFLSISTHQEYLVYRIRGETRTRPLTALQAPCSADCVVCSPRKALRQTSLKFPPPSESL